MALQQLPSTPKVVSVAAPAPAIPASIGNDSRTPGKWRHPRLDEIVRRQNATTFGERHVKRIAWNGAALMASVAFGNSVMSSMLWLQSLSQIPMYPDLALFTLQAVFVLNILVALYPLVRPKDNLSDIPLTPTQRKLLGLDPSAAQPLTPGTTYVTPPRYRLSSSRQASPAGRSASPSSASAGMSGRRASGNGSFSPSSSPLMQKAFPHGASQTGRRPSFGTPSPLGSRSSPFGESGMGPTTPTPAGGKRASIGLSNKWLYERSRRLSASNGVL